MRIKVQQLDRQVHNSFFQVMVWKEGRCMPDDIYLKDLEERLEQDDFEHNEGGEGGINARQISPWLLTTRWHEHVAGHDPVELKGLVATPKKDEFPGLHDAV